MGFLVGGLTLEELEVKTTEFVVSGLTLVLRGFRNEMDFSSGKSYRFIYREEILELKSALLSLHVLGSRKESFLVDILVLDVRNLVSGGYNT